MTSLRGEADFPIEIQCNGLQIWLMEARTGSQEIE